MEMKHFEEEKVYLISNYAVARNPIFYNKAIQMRFKSKMEKYLSPIANIIAFNLRDHEFQILLKLKERKEFEIFYNRNKGKSIGLEIPESTYIFSQQMSNLQVSIVKHINYKLNRSGTLMAGRFKRSQIINPEEIISLVERMNNGKMNHSYSGIWINELYRGVSEMTSKNLYSDKYDLENGKFEGFINGIEINLVGHFAKPEKTKDFPSIYYYQRHLFRAFCKFHE
jgi:hypothetical protein